MVCLHARTTNAVPVFLLRTAWHQVGASAAEAAYLELSSGDLLKVRRQESQE